MLERILSLIGSKHGAAIEFCSALGLPRNMVTEWRSGRSKSYRKYTAQIAAHYGVSLDWLSGVTDDRGQKNTPTPKSEGSDVRRKIDLMLNEMSEEQLKKYLSVLELLDQK